VSAFKWGKQIANLRKEARKGSRIDGSPHPGRPPLQVRQQPTLYTPRGGNRK